MFLLLHLNIPIIHKSQRHSDGLVLKTIQKIDCVEPSKNNIQQRLWLHAMDWVQTQSKPLLSLSISFESWCTYVAHMKLQYHLCARGWQQFHRGDKRTYLNIKLHTSFLSHVLLHCLFGRYRGGVPLPFFTFLTLYKNFFLCTSCP